MMTPKPYRRHIDVLVCWCDDNKMLVNKCPIITFSGSRHFSCTKTWLNCQRYQNFKMIHDDPTIDKQQLGVKVKKDKFAKVQL